MEATAPTAVDFWDARYEGEAYAYGTEPNAYFRQQLDALPPARFGCGGAPASTGAATASTGAMAGMAIGPASGTPAAIRTSPSRWVWRTRGSSLGASAASRAGST